MADRSVKVRLEADISQYKRELAEAAVATTLAGRATDRLGADLGKTESQARRTGAEIDRLSGRLRLFTDAALIVGPALAPLGAAAVGGIVALSSQFGALAGAMGVTVLALNGVGDGLKALNAYQLEPTADNLAKLNQEMERLGPSGEQFVRYLDSIGPELRTLQFAARDGLLPGAEEGIDRMLQRLPELRSLISVFASEVGDLAADSGEAFAGDRFDAFLDYLGTDGVRILDDTARTLGFLAEAAANTMQAFAPTQTNFSGGLLDFAEGLAEASANLEGSDGFNQFLTYINESGPQVLDTLGALANAMLQIVEATAPLGGPVLAALEGVANAIAVIADSDLGTPIFAALGALALYNRGLAATTALTATSFGGKAKAQVEGYVGTLTTVTSAQDRARMSAADLAAVERSRNRELLAGAGKAAAAMGGLALATTGVAESTGVSNTATLALMGTMAGPWGAAIGGAVGLTMDFAAANDGLEDSLNAVRLAADSGNIGLYADSIAKAREELEKMEVGNDKNQNFLAGFSGLSELPEAWSLISGATGDARDEFSAAEADMERLRATGGRSIGTLSDFAGVMRDSADAAQEEADALYESIAAMRTKRSEALRAANAELNYEQAIDDANKALKENGRTVDKTTEAGRANRRALYDLAATWNQQSDAAKNAQGAMKAARRNFIETATSMGMAEDKAKRLANRLFEIPTKRKIDITADTGQADAALRALKARMDGIHSKVVTVTVNQNVRPMGGQAPGSALAEGGTVPGPRHPYGDKMMILAAPGEEIITNRRGEADRFRADRAAGRIPRYDRGGTVGSGSGNDTYTSISGMAFGTGFELLNDAAAGAAQGLKGLKKRLEEAERQLEKEKNQRKALIEARDAFAGAVGGAYSASDPFEGNLASFDTALAANTNDTRAAEAALSAASANGLNGPLYQALAQSGNLSLLQEFAGLSAADISVREQQFASQSSAQAGLGAGAANQEFAKAIREQNKELREAQRERKKLANKLEALEKSVERGSERGTRAGMNDRDRWTASRVRTG